MPFYERGPVRIHYEEVGSGFPLLLIPGGGLNSALASWQTASPFNPMDRYLTTSAVSAVTCATPTLGSPAARWRSTVPGTLTPTTSSGCWTTSASASFWSWDFASAGR